MGTTLLPGIAQPRQPRRDSPLVISYRPVAGPDRRTMIIVGIRPDVSAWNSAFIERGRAGAVLEQHVARRTISAAALAGIALIHVLNLIGTMHELPYLGGMYLGLIASSLVIARGLIRKDDLLRWFAAGGLAASVLIGYTISRTVGLPGDHGADIGNWSEPLGLASVVVEGFVLLLVLGRFTSQRN